MVGMLCLIVFSAIPLNAQRSVYQFVKNECPFAPPGQAVKCGTLTVPEDRNFPAGNQVHIAVAVFPAQSDLPAPDPVFYLDGGPGASTLERFGSNFAYTFSELNQTRDVVLLDYRGAGASEPSLFCDEVATYIRKTLNKQNQNQQTRQSYTAALNRCHKRLVDTEHIDLGMFRGAVIAQDVVDLQEALGYKEINLFGGSYGTRLALTILRDHPDGIRSVLLDGVYPPHVDRSAGSILNANRAFEELFTACAHAVTCNAAFPDLRDEFYRTANQLNQSPAMIHVDTAYNYAGSDLRFTGNAFISYVFNALYSTGLIPSLPLIIDQVAKGNYAQMSQVVSNKIDSDSTISLGLYLAIECSDENPFNTPKASIDAAESVPLGEFYLNNASVSDNNTPDGCTSWGTDSPDPIENEPVASNVPVLIFNGEFDPVTPPGWGELAAQTLPNSRVITFPGLGHGAFFSGSSCSKQIAVAFFSNPEVHSEASCIDDTPIRWITVDLSDSLLATEAKIDVSGYWYSDYQQSTLYWNSERWSDEDYLGILAITDYLAVSFPQKVDKYWFNRRFGLWGSYQMREECARGNFSLYEFTVASRSHTSFIIRYWVDRTNTDKIRDVLLALPADNQIRLDTDSLTLVPELPAC
jgi:pimeloyl-ACP methyl ester carboxylesterase